MPTTTEAIILPMKYSNGIYLVGMQRQDRNNGMFFYTAKSLVLSGNKGNLSFKSRQRSVIAVGCG